MRWLLEKFKRLSVSSVFIFRHWQPQFNSNLFVTAIWKAGHLSKIDVSESIRFMKQYNIIYESTRIIWFYDILWIYDLYDLYSYTYPDAENNTTTQCSLRNSTLKIHGVFGLSGCLKLCEHDFSGLSGWLCRWHYCGVNIPEKKHIAEKNKKKRVQKYERITFQKGTYPSLFHGNTLF